jgi:hypothetical protein
MYCRYIASLGFFLALVCPSYGYACSSCFAAASLPFARSGRGGTELVPKRRRGRVCISALMQEGRGSPTVAFESDARLPSSLLSPALLKQLKAPAPGGVLQECRPFSLSEVEGFVELERALDRVILLEAEREKERLASGLQVLRGQHGGGGGGGADELAGDEPIFPHSHAEFVEELSRPLMDAGFRMASKRDLAISSALQSASQRVLRSEVVVDDQQLIDLIAKPCTSLPSSKVLIFWRGAGVQQRAGGLFFEKLDFIQGEVLSLVLGFWVENSRAAWRRVSEGRDALADGVGSAVGVAKGTASSLLEQVNASRIGSAANFSLSSSRLGSGTERAKGRIRSARIGSMEVMTPDEVLRRQSIRGRALKRSGRKRARALLNRVLARWGLVSLRSHELDEFMPGGSWPPASKRPRLVQMAAMQTAFASAMKQARESCGHDIANWRAILSALLRIVTVQDPMFEETVVVFAKRAGGSDMDHATQPVERFFERAVVYFLSSIDPGLPDAWGFSRKDALPAGDMTPARPQVGLGMEGDLSQRKEAAVASLGQTQFSSHVLRLERASLSVSAYSGIKVKNLLTIFPDHKLQFRPLDSFKLDLVTAVTFISIAINKFGRDDVPFSDLVAVASATVWVVGVYYRIQARCGVYGAVVVIVCVCCALCCSSLASMRVARGGLIQSRARCLPYSHTSPTRLRSLCTLALSWHMNTHGMHLRQAQRVRTCEQPHLGREAVCAQRQRGAPGRG